MNSTNTVPNEPERKNPVEEPRAAIDTSKMSAGQRAALELTEAARDAATERGSFAGGLFMGQFGLDAVHPFPSQKPEDRDQGDAFLQRLESFLREQVDPDEIDRTGEIPPGTIKELAAMGAFGMYNVSTSPAPVGFRSATDLGVNFGAGFRFLVGTRRGFIEIRYHHCAGAFRSEPQRERASDSAAGAGDHHVPVGELHRARRLVEVEFDPRIEGDDRDGL